MNSIKSNILTFAVLATLIPSLGLGLLSFWRYQVVINESMSHELRTLARDTSGEVALWQRERVHELRALSTAYTLIDGLTMEAAPRPGQARIGAPELGRYLRSVQQKLDPFLELTLTDSTGHVVASSALEPSPIALPDAWSSKAITEGVVAAPPRWDATRSTATLTVAVPVLSQRNELLGALSAVLDLSQVQARVQDVVRSSPAEVLLLTPDGQPLLSSRGAVTGLTPLAPDLLQRVRAQPGEATSYVGHHQRDAIGVADPPRALPIVVIAERERAEAFAAWLELLQYFLVLVVALALLVGVVAYWMGRSIVTPLNRLTRAADRIARGDLSVALRDDTADEIGRLTRVFNLMTDRLRTSRTEIETANAALRDQNQLLETLAVTDSLTGLFNRKKLEEILDEQFAHFRSTGRPFALLMLDLDNFKSINDSYGHVAGDEVLVKVAAMLKQEVRNIDYAARYGGVEFVVVLVDTDLGAAQEVAERIRLIIEAPSIRAGNQLIAVTVSLGVTHSHVGDEGPEMMLFRAHHALYQAKRAGRDQVQLAN